MPIWMQILPWGLLGKWVKYNVIFTYTLFSDQPTGHTVRPILTHDDSENAKSDKNVV